jgi:hypothetical protein
VNEGVRVRVRVRVRLRGFLALPVELSCDACSFHGRRAKATKKLSGVDDSSMQTPANIGFGRDSAAR